MKLTSKIHGLLDYVVVLFLWASPTLFGLPPITAMFTYILGAVHLILTLSTEFEMGIFKIIPFKIHGLIELIVSLVLIGVGFYLGSLEGKLASNFYFGFSAAVFITWLISDYKTEKSTSI